MNYLARTEAAEFLRSQGYPVAKNTLQKYATTGGGPKFRRFGNRVLYTPEDLTGWAESKLSEPMNSTSCEEAA
jgi:hypothetical protein